jgi:hypothetical protein
MSQLADDLAGPVCKGSWLLGTACGHCQRCIKEAPEAIAALRATLDVSIARTTLIVSMIPPRAPLNYDFVDSVKIKMFDAIREQLYDKEGNLR